VKKKFLNFSEQRISFDVNFQLNSTSTLFGNGIDGSTSKYGEYLRSNLGKNRDILNLIGRLSTSENLCISQERMGLWGMVECIDSSSLTTYA